VTHKPSGLTGTYDMQAIGSHRSDDEEGFHRYTSDGRMKKGPSGDFYDKLPTSQMSNCRSHMYSSDGEMTMWRFMMKCHSLQIEYYSSEMYK
jgi:hypothetical protein